MEGGWAQEARRPYAYPPPPSRHCAEQAVKAAEGGWKPRHMVAEDFEEPAELDDAGMEKDLEQPPGGIGCLARSRRTRRHGRLARE